MRTGGKHRVTQSHIVVTYIVVVHDAPSLVSSWMHGTSMHWTSMPAGLRLLERGDLPASYFSIFF